MDVIRQARLVQDKEKPSVKYNGVDYHYPEDLREMSEEFLQTVDRYMTKIASLIEPRLKDDFAQVGLKNFKSELRDHIEEFDQLWMKFETEFVKARHDILAKVFAPIDRLVNTEMALSQAEDRLDIEAKIQLENELVYHIESFTNELFPETTAEKFPNDVIVLAEACIFYESKCTEEWLHLAKYLIKDYLQWRMLIMKIPEERLKPQLMENQELVRCLLDFHASVLAARKGLDFVSRQPKLIHAKTTDWMTAQILEPDLKYIQRVAKLTRDANQGKL